jgi:hypothetical protein
VLFPASHLAWAAINQVSTSSVNYYRAMWRPVDSAVGAALKQPLAGPVLLLWGEEDAALGRELTHNTDRYAKALTTRFFPGASHWLQVMTGTDPRMSLYGIDMRLGPRLASESRRALASMLAFRGSLLGFGVRGTLTHRGRAVGVGLQAPSDPPVVVRWSGRRG